MSAQAFKGTFRRRKEKGNRQAVMITRVLFNEPELIAGVSRLEAR